ncbi:hypothetical protein F5X99DRAFT_397596 [Biscogniauxia marginata]|nr:hypothetical protein F5X99DRAFT_397596 [Biscogniauxia marginata]
MIGTIYRMTKCVVLWLGESAVKNDAFFKRLDRKNNLDSAENTARDTTVLERSRGEDMGDLCREILYRPWFERSWTL